MQSLKAFVYVSTAFSNSDILEIYEKVYPIDVDPNVIAVLFKGLSTSLLNTIAPMLIGKKINFYTFSKHLAEVLVQDAQSHVPVCIVRPTIVGPAHREPFPGWVDNFNGYSGFISGSSKGVIRCVYCTSQGTIDVVPVDHVVNLTLVAAMNLGSGSRKMNDLIVYNHSNTPNPYIYSKCQGSLISAFEDNPPNEMFWYPSMIFTKSHVVFAIASFFFHYIPALLADGISIIAGKTPR
ncbi:unnamed protein product [Allacma fusca]|uniref:Fatty acyl-CoA reductase n=1 Tax=Allacma fusca TaxID=39272 RepID=A0A8J2JEI6_9HEXA|nr:unnamed protein product [Allacma fusca]